MSVQYTAIFHGCKNANFHMKKCEIFLNFAQNIDRWYTEAVLTSTHDLCFRAKIRVCKQYKIFTAFWDFIPKCRSWRIVDAVKDKKKKKKKKKDQNKNNKSKKEK